MEEQKKLIFVLNFIYSAVVALICFLAFRYLFLWFWPFFFSLALAYLFRHLARHCRAKTRLATAAAGICFYCTVILLFWSLLALLIGRLIEFANSFPLYYYETLLPYYQMLGARLLEIVRQLAPSSVISLSELFEMMSATVQELVTSLSAAFISWVTEFIRKMPLFLIGFVFMIVSSFAIAMDYAGVTQFLMRQLPHKARPLMLDIKNFLISCLFRLGRAYTIIMLITFCELCIGLWALKINGFWKIAAIIAMLDIFPLLGSGGVLIPWGIFELISQNTALGSGLLLLYATIAVMRNIIEPHVVGDSLGLHPVVTLSAMFFGLHIFGILGMLAAPIAALLIRFLNENGKVHLYR